MLWFPPRSPLHSHPERHFHVLPSPDLHLIIIGTDVFKVGLGDGEEATSKRRGSGETEGEYVYLLGKRGVGTYVWKAVDSLLTPTTDPNRFPGMCSPSSTNLFIQQMFIELLLLCPLHLWEPG